jgi:hypothetical protein
MTRVYRYTLGVRLLLGAAGILIVSLGLFLLLVASFADGPDAERAWTVALAVLTIVLGVLQLWFMRAKLVADDDGVEIVNWFSRRRFTWSEIDRFEVGFAYWGVSVVPAEGPPVKVNAVQKPNLLHWMGKRGRADRIVDELNALLADRRAPPIPPPPPPPPV